MAKLVSADNRAGKSAKRRPNAKLHPSVYGEWAALAAMRAGWEHDAARLTIAFPGHTALAELAVGATPLLSGLWSCEVSVNGIPAMPTGDWEEICWESDDDVDYLELEIDLTEGIRLQRHIVLARDDGFALLADAVLGQQPAQLDYCGRLPLCAGVQFRVAGANTEGILSGKRPLARVLPLACPSGATPPGRAHCGARTGTWNCGKRRSAARCLPRCGSTSTARGCGRRSPGGRSPSANGSRRCRPRRPPAIAWPSAGNSGSSTARSAQGQPHAAGPQPVERNARRPLRPQRRRHAADRD